MVWSEKYGFDLKHYLKNFKTPTLFIQQTDDPFCPFKELKNLLEENKVRNYVIKEVLGEDHSSYDLVEIKKLAIDFMGKSDL